MLSQILANISNLIIPLILFFVAGYGLLHKVKVYEVFVKGEFIFGELHTKS